MDGDEKQNKNCCISLCVVGIIISNELFFSGNKYPKSFLSVCVACVFFFLLFFCAPGSHMNTNTSVKGQ